MRDTKELLNTEIYPAIYQMINIIFPEFQFIRISNGFISTTDIKITGERGAKGKVYIYDNNIGHLKDYTRASISIWDYIKQRENCNSQQETLIKLAQLSGVKLPKGEGDYNLEDYTNYKQRAELWETVNGYLIWNLKEAKGKAETVRKYLAKRGYTKEDIEVMELGFMPAQSTLKKYLIEKKDYDPAEVEEIKLHTAIGDSHTLTIPLREPAGNIAGITVRNINAKEGDRYGKYLNSTGLTKTDKLFNLRAFKGKKRIVLVEGLLDCLLASARGVENIVALGGKSLNIKQLETALKYGTESIVICLDNEPGTVQDILRAIELIKDNSDIKIYVAILPDKIKDVDELIRSKGAEALKTVIEQAIPYWEYNLHILAKEYYNTENPTAQKEDEFLEQVYITASKIKEPIDRERYIRLFLTDPGVTELGITKETLENKAEEIRAKENSIKQAQEFKALINDISKKIETGKTEEALETLNTKAKELGLSKLKQKSISFTDFLKDKQAKDRNRTAGLLGYGLNKFSQIAKDLDGVQAGLYVIGAYTNVGKTALLSNLFLDLVESNKEITGLYISLDDSRNVISNRLLSILSGLSINTVQKKPQYPDEAKNLEDTYKKLLTLIAENRIDLKDIAEITNINILEAVVSNTFKNNNKMFVCIDGLYNLDLGKATKGKREEAIELANGIKKLVDTYNIPILCTGELRKPAESKGRATTPSIDDLMETGKLAYNSNLVWVLYPEDREKFKTEPEPILRLSYDKNKLSHYKGYRNFTFVKKSNQMLYKNEGF